jgi:hypothetical protein
MILAASLLGQTRINGTLQFRWPDFSAQTFSRPWPMGTSLPVACQVGEAYFLNNAQTGRRLYLCTQSNVWTEIAAPSGGGGGGIAQSADLPDFQASKNGANQLRIGTACTPAKPCRARFGGKLVTLTDTAIVTLQSPTATGNLFVWLSELGVRAGHSTQASVSCNAACGVSSGISVFPAGVIPLAIVPFTNNVLADLTPAMDLRAYVYNLKLEAGSSGNVRVLENTGSGSLSVDLGSELDFGGLVSTKVTRRGSLASRPPACAPGDLYYQTDGETGLYHCPAPNLWTAVGGGGNLAVQADGVAVGARNAFNLAPGTGTGVSCADDAVNGRVTCAVGIDGSFLNSTHARLGNVANTYATGHISDFRAATAFYVPAAPGANPSAAATLAYDLTANVLKFGTGTATRTLTTTEQVSYPVFLHASNTGVPAAATRFLGAGVHAWSATENEAATIVPVAGVLSRLFVRTNGAQPADNALTCTVRRNGTDTASGVTIAASAAAGIYSDLADTVALSQGDLLAIRCVNSSAAASAAITSIAVWVQ